MNRETFNERKATLVNLINTRLDKVDLFEHDRIALITIIELLNLYSFENRLYQKGVLSHMVIDSLELDYSIGEKIIAFEKDIM